MWGYMAIEELTNYYYDKLLYYSVQTNSKISEYIKIRGTIIKNYLKVIIYDNNHHILSDSFLVYLSQEELINYKFDLIIKDEQSRIKLLTNYYYLLIDEAYSNGYYDENRKNHSNPSLMYLYLDENMKEVINSYVKELKGIYIKYPSQSTILKKIFIIMLSYLCANNRLYEANSLVNTFLLNINYFIDDITINNISSNSKELFDRSISYMNLFPNKKVLRKIETIN